MNLIFIYGPPAAGKLTVAKKLGKKLGYKVFQNHTIVGCISDIFPFGDKKLQPILRRLSVKFRLEIYEEAAKNNISFVTTYGGNTKRFTFFKDVKEIVEKYGGRICFVQLLPSEDALVKRVVAPTRQKVKIDNVDYLRKQLIENPEYFQKFLDIEHITIDNTDLTPAQVVEKVAKYYKL